MLDFLIFFLFIKLSSLFWNLGNFLWLQIQLVKMQTVGEKF